KVWDQKNVNIEAWLSDYVVRRYGREEASALGAWKHLSKAAYARTRTMWSPLLTRPRLMIFKDGRNEDVRHIRSEYSITSDNPFAWDFDVMEMAKAADLLLACAEKFRGVETYRFDLANVWRELLHSLTHTMINDISTAYTKQDVEGV